MDPLVINHRRTNLGTSVGTDLRGFASEANVGWIKLGTETETHPAHFEKSRRRILAVAASPAVPGIPAVAARPAGPGIAAVVGSPAVPGRPAAPGRPAVPGAHTEELLVAWAQAHGANLALAPGAPGPGIRVKALYTERQPCTPAESAAADNDDRRERLGTHGSCHALLTAVLHAQVPVYYSVDNAPAPHYRLRVGAWRTLVRSEAIRLVTQAGNARLQAFGLGHHHDLGVIRDTHVGNISAIPQMTLSEFDFANYRTAVRIATAAGIAAIQAWSPQQPTIAPGPPATGAPPPGPPPPGGGAPGKRSGADAFGSMPAAAANRPKVSSAGATTH